MQNHSAGKRGIGYGLAFLLLLALLVLSFYPILWMFLGSFKSINDIYQNPLSFPTRFDFSVYPDAWRLSDYGTALRNSLTVTGVAVLLIVSISSLAAYAFAVMEFRGKNALYNFIIAGQIISAQIVLIPMFAMFRDMNLLNTRWSVICAYTAVGIPLSMLLLRNSFREVPREIYESAKIDGSSSLRYFFRFLLPLSKPGLASVIIYQSLFAWNEYIFALTFLNAGDKKTLPLILAVFFGRYSSDWTRIFAILTLSVAPVLLLYLLLQKYFIKGLTAGAIKG